MRVRLNFRTLFWERTERRLENTVIFLADSAGHVWIPAERMVVYIGLPMDTETDSWAVLLLMNTNHHTLNKYAF